MMKKGSMKYLVLIAFAFTWGNIFGQNSSQEVLHAGQLRDIMHKNDISAKVEIDSLLRHEHLYAVGAIDSLRGEILIENGILYTSRVKGDSALLFKSQHAKATLLVYTYVKKWKEISLPDTLSSLQSLETFLGYLSNKQGVNKPLPFRLTGQPESVTYHVIGPVEGNATHEERKSAGFAETLGDEKLSIVGFYSDQHYGVFTHRDSRIHMHMRSEVKSKMGHVDDIKIVRNVKLYIPED